MNSGSKSIPVVSNSIWINVNLRVSYGNYILMNAWQGNNWYDISPGLKILFVDATTPGYLNNTLLIEPTLASVGLSIADIRVFSLISS